jgi:hypothetical protein
MVVIITTTTIIISSSRHHLIIIILILLLIVIIIIIFRRRHHDRHDHHDHHHRHLILILIILLLQLTQRTVPAASGATLSAGEMVGSLALQPRAITGVNLANSLARPTVAEAAPAAVGIGAVKPVDGSRSLLQGRPRREFGSRRHTLLAM